MIADLYKALEIFYSDYFYTTTNDIYVDGELVIEKDKETKIRCAVFPVTGDDLRNSNAGEYSKEDIVILTEGNSVLRTGDILLANNKKYEIRNQIDLSGIVNIQKFLAKKCQ